MGKGVEPGRVRDEEMEGDDLQQEQHKDISMGYEYISEDKTYCLLRPSNRDLTS